MLVVTSDKALLRAVWEIVEHRKELVEVTLTEVAEYLNALDKGTFYPEELENDALLLQRLGFMRLRHIGGGRFVKLTQVGALLATNLRFSAAPATGTDSSAER